MRGAIQDYPDNQWFYCIHCERAFLGQSIVRLGSGELSCPYVFCGGREIDFTGWKNIVEWNPSYPSIPVPDEVYPLSR